MKATILTFVLVALLSSNARPSALFLDRSFSMPGVFRIDGMAFNPTSGTLFGVNAAGTDTLYEFTTDGDLLAVTSLVSLPGVGGSRSLAFNPNSGNLLLGEFAGGQVHEFTTDGTLLRSLALSDGYVFAGMTYDPASDNLLLIGNLIGLAPAVLEVDLEYGTVVVGRAVPSGYSRGVGFDGTNLVFLSSDNSRILRMDPSSGVVVDTSPSGITDHDSGATFADGAFYVWNDDESRVDVFIPEPSSLVFGIIALGAAMMRRRR